MRLAVVISLCVALATPARAAGDDEERARGHYEIGLGLYRLGDYPAALKEFAAGYELAHKPGFLLNLGQTYRKLGELREARDLYRQFLAEVRSDDPSRPQAQRVLQEIEAALRKQARTAPTPSPAALAPPHASPATPAPQHASPAAPAPQHASPAEPPIARASSTARAPAAETAPPTVSSRSAPVEASSPASPAPVVTPPAVAAQPADEPTTPAAAEPTPVVVTPAPSLQTGAPPRRPRRALRIAGLSVGVVGLGLVGAGIGTAVAADGLAHDLDAIDRAGGVFDPAKDRAYTLDRTLSAAFFGCGAALAAGAAVLLIVSAR